MTHFPSDYHRLDCISFELWQAQAGINMTDVENATALGQVFGSPEQIRKFGKNPTEPINRVCGELIKHAEKRSESPRMLSTKF